VRQLLLNLQAASFPTRENFIPGNNVETLVAYDDWLAMPPQTPKLETLWMFWGGPGSGKSHLLAASSFIVVDARQHPALDTLSVLMEAHLQVAVDHVEALLDAPNETGQIALFHAFNHLRAVGGKLLCAANRPPASLPLREDLRTRLGNGLIYRLEPLADTEKKTALANMAAARALPLTAETLDYLLSHASRDMRVLSDLIAVLDRLSLERKRPITISLLRETLAEYPHIGP
jgi:DnaA family protein